MRSDSSFTGCLYFQPVGLGELTVREDDDVAGALRLQVHDDEEILLLNHIICLDHTMKK